MDGIMVWIFSNAKKSYCIAVRFFYYKQSSFPSTLPWKCLANYTPHASHAFRSTVGTVAYCECHRRFKILLFRFHQNELNQWWKRCLQGMRQWEAGRRRQPPDITQAGSTFEYNINVLLKKKKICNQLINLQILHRWSKCVTLNSNQPFPVCVCTLR